MKPISVSQTVRSCCAHRSAPLHGNRRSPLRNNDHGNLSGHQSNKAKRKTKLWLIRSIRSIRAIGFSDVTDLCLHQ